MDIRPDLGRAQDLFEDARRQLEIARTSPAPCIQRSGVRSAIPLIESALALLAGIERDFADAEDLQSAELADEMRGRA